MKKTLYTLLAAMLVMDMAEGIRRERAELRAAAAEMGVSSLSPCGDMPLTLRRHNPIGGNKYEGLLPGQSEAKKARKDDTTAIPLPVVSVVSPVPVVLHEMGGSDTTSCFSSDSEEDDKNLTPCSLSNSKEGNDSDTTLCSSSNSEDGDIPIRECVDLSEKTLNLSGCTFDVIELIDALENGGNEEFKRGTLSSLYVLNLSRSNIDTVGVNALLTSIFRGRAGGKRFSVVAQIFAPRGQIQWRELNFSGCGITDDGIKELIWALGNGYLPYLRTLDFSGCNLSDKCKQKLDRAVDDAVTCGRTIDVYY